MCTSTWRGRQSLYDYCSPWQTHPSRTRECLSRISQSGRPKESFLMVRCQWLQWPVSSVASPPPFSGTTARNSAITLRILYWPSRSMNSSMSWAMSLPRLILLFTELTMKRGSSWGKTWLVPSFQNGLALSKALWLETGVINSACLTNWLLLILCSSNVLSVSPLTTYPSFPITSLISTKTSREWWIMWWASPK